MSSTTATFSRPAVRREVVSTAEILDIVVMDDIDYTDEMDQYKIEKRKSESSAKNWEENDAKGYNLVLQHCPAELEAELKNQDAWGEVENTRRVVRLLKHPGSSAPPPAPPGSAAVRGCTPSWRSLPSSLR